jgi:hypothetical protein
MEAYERFAEISSSPFKHRLPPQPLELFTTSHHTPVQLAIRVPLVSHSRSRSSSILAVSPSLPYSHGFRLPRHAFFAWPNWSCFLSLILQFLHLFLIPMIAGCFTMFCWRRRIKPSFLCSQWLLQDVVFRVFQDVMRNSFLCWSCVKIIAWRLGLATNLILVLSSKLFNGPIDRAHLFIWCIAIISLLM